MSRRPLRPWRADGSWASHHLPILPFVFFSSESRLATALLLFLRTVMPLAAATADPWSAAARPGRWAGRAYQCPSGSLSPLLYFVRLCLPMWLMRARLGRPSRRGLSSVGRPPPACRPLLYSAYSVHTVPMPVDSSRGARRASGPVCAVASVAPLTWPGVAAVAANRFLTNRRGTPPFSEFSVNNTFLFYLALWSTYVS